ncbi:MAG: hypothetical protein F6K31_33195 [Symploca sp. SIO2G7]|nr:hypothetical protein [Symploca sp. SIO2G7]
MNKFILGCILAVISLLAIYGTSASNRVASWVDGENRSSAQADSNNGRDDTTLGLNSAESASGPDISGRTPLQKAGDIPQRQTVGVPGSPNFGSAAQSDDATDDTGGEIIDPARDEQATSSEPTNESTSPAETPIRALW